ncbi:MAG: acetylxylan esterase [Lentisphaerae bacterium]|nr:acetylxylan esterase [Lentisphaerota bacterium]
MMSVKSFVQLVLGLALLFAATLRANPVAGYTIAGRADRDHAIYQLGEEMTFTLRPLQPDGQPAVGKLVKWERRGDDGISEEAIVTVDNEPIIIKTSGAKPGFIYIRAYYCSPEGKPIGKPDIFRLTDEFNGGAGVAVEQIPISPEPPDFDAFWAAQKAELAKVPLVVLEKKFVATIAAHELYEVTLSCVPPRPVTGYLTIPVGAAPQSLHAVVGYHGYGVPTLKAPTSVRRPGVIFFDVNAHGYKLSQPEEYYAGFRKGELAGYGHDVKENENPANCYFTGMMLRDLRALEFVRSLPAWNGKTLETTGGSQGGMQALNMAGLDPTVTLVTPWVPWLGDIGRVDFGRMGQRVGTPYSPGLKYLDPVYHVKRIAHPEAFVKIGFAGLGDYSSVPSSIMLMYRNMSCKKELKFFQGGMHGTAPKDAQVTLFQDEARK